MKKKEIKKEKEKHKRKNALWIQILTFTHFLLGIVYTPKHECHYSYDSNNNLVSL